MLEEILWLWDTVFRHPKPNPNQLALTVFPSIAELVDKLFGCDILLHQTLEVNLVGVRTWWQTLLFPKCCPSVVIQSCIFPHQTVGQLLSLQHIQFFLSVDSSKKMFAASKKSLFFEIASLRAPPFLFHVNER